MVFIVSLDMSSHSVLAQEVQAAVPNQVAIVALWSNMTTSDLERAASILRISEGTATRTDEFNVKASCVLPVGDKFVKELATQDYGAASRVPFRDLPIFALLQIDGVTVLKVNAGRQVWKGDDLVYEISYPDFRFLEGMFIGLTLEKDCLVANQ